MNSLRGNYILSQALHYAIRIMKEIPDPYKETSNIQDMEMMREEIFMFPIELLENEPVPVLASQEPSDVKTK